MSGSLSGKRVVVVGAGASGLAAARLAASRGARVVLTDAKTLDAWSSDARAAALAGVFMASPGGHGGDALAAAELVVVSPGVPPFAELVAAARAGVPVWGEVELATRELRHPAPIVAVGGTNGKSTTTELLGALLGGAGRRVFVGGNLGEPLALHADERFDRIVLEVSSFQMERVDTFHPRVALLLNVTPDHLDRYPDPEAYAAAKGNAFLRQTPDDVAVVPAGDAVCARQAARGRGQVVTFGPGGDVDVDAEHVRDRARGLTVRRADLALTGGHNALNVAAALAALRAFDDVSAEHVHAVLASFRGLPHRTALVAELDGVRYYDDSKGTNVGAAVTALVGLVEPRAVLVAGGRDKGGSYGPLVDALRTKGRAVVLLGEASELIASAVGDALPVRRVASMDEAVRVARELARPGDAVLLSPACSSFDMFRDYKHRGDEFVRAVRSMEASR